MRAEFKTNYQNSQHCYVLFLFFPQFFRDHVFEFGAKLGVSLSLFIERSGLKDFEVKLTRLDNKGFHNF